jgi:hypothetical protein
MASSTTAAKRIEEAKAISPKDPAKAEAIYKDVLSHGIGGTESASRDYETALVGLGELYRDNKNAQELAELIKTSRDSFTSFAKAKTAKLGEQLYGNEAVWKALMGICCSSTTSRPS